MSRTQIQIDVSPEFRHQLKLLALKNNKTLKDFVILTLVSEYPELTKYGIIESKKRP